MLSPSSEMPSVSSRNVLVHRVLGLDHAEGLGQRGRDLRPAVGDDPADQLLRLRGGLVPHQRDRPFERIVERQDADAVDRAQVLDHA